MVNVFIVCRGGWIRGEMGAQKKLWKKTGRDRWRVKSFYVEGRDISTKSRPNMRRLPFWQPHNSSLFSCTKHPTDLTPDYMWAAPLQVKQFLAALLLFAELPPLQVSFDSFPSQNQFPPVFLSSFELHFISFHPSM